MSYVAKGEKEYDATGAPVPAAKIHKIRITLTSRNVKNLEKCTSRLARSGVWYFHSHLLNSLE
jgi:small subunit ribosomal protein S20e